MLKHPVVDGGAVIGLCPAVVAHTLAGGKAHIAAGPAEHLHHIGGAGQVFMLIVMFYYKMVNMVLRALQ